RSADGEARVDQELALLEGVVTLFPGWIRPVLSAGIGAYRLGVVGSGVAPYQGVSNDLWAFAADAGAGAELAFSQNIALAIEAHGFMSFPYPSVRIGSEELGPVAHPSLATSLSLVIGR